MIPFSPPYIDNDVVAEVTNTLQSGWITTGSKTRMLEEEIAAFCRVEKALALNSGTSALMLALHWFGISRGDEVIIPAYTYCATALAVMHTGAIPVMVDISGDFTIDPEKIAAAITPRTKAVIAVDFGGWPSDYEKIYAVINSPEAKKQFMPVGNNQQQLGRILVLSDAAHAIGAVYNNFPVGKCADLTIFSLHAVKNVTTAEGGVIVFNMPAAFNNTEVYKILRLWSLNGQTKDAFTKSVAGGWEYDVVYPGFKMNMPDVLAAIGLVQFRKYQQELLAERKRVFNLYNELLCSYEWAICPPFYKKGCSTSCHLYPLRIEDMDEAGRNLVIQEITKEAISVNVHFKPLPLLTVFKDNGYNIKAYPQSYAMYCNEISLPVYPQLTNEQCADVVNAVIKAVTAVFENLHQPIC